MLVGDAEDESRLDVREEKSGNGVGIRRGRRGEEISHETTQGTDGSSHAHKTPQGPSSYVERRVKDPIQCNPPCPWGSGSEIWSFLVGVP